MRKLKEESWAIIRANPKAEIVRGLVRRDLHRVLKASQQEELDNDGLIKLIKEMEDTPVPIPAGAMTLEALAIDAGAPPLPEHRQGIYINQQRKTTECVSGQIHGRITTGDMLVGGEDYQRNMQRLATQGIIEHSLDDWEEVSNDYDDVELDEDEDFNPANREEYALFICYATPMSVARMVAIERLFTPRAIRRRSDLILNPAEGCLKDPAFLLSVWQETKLVIESARKLIEESEGYELPDSLPDLSLLPGQAVAGVALTAVSLAAIPTADASSYGIEIPDLPAFADSIDSDEDSSTECADC